MPYAEEPNEQKGTPENHSRVTAQFVYETFHTRCGSYVTAKCIFMQEDKKAYCPQANTCPLKRLRHDLEQTSPAFWGFIMRELKARETLENVGLTLLEGDDEQRRTANYWLSVLLQAAEPLFASLLTAYETLEVPYINNDLIALIKSRPRTPWADPYVEVMADARKMRVEVLPLPLTMREKERAILSEILQVYFGVLKRQLDWLEPVTAYIFTDFEWMEAYLRQARNQKQNALVGALS